MMGNIGKKQTTINKREKKMPCLDQIHKYLPGAQIFSIGQQFFENKCSRVIRVVATHLSTIDNVDGIGSRHKSFQKSLPWI